MKIKKSLVLFIIVCGIEKVLCAEGIVRVNFQFAQKQLEYAIKEVAAARKLNNKKTNTNLLVSPRNIEPDGSLRLVASKDWTSGFFAGELWYMYEYTGENYWKEKAEESTKLIEQEQWNGKTHDMGFKIYCSYGNGFRLTHNEEYKRILIQSARTLSTRYKKNVGCLRSWDHSTDSWDYPVIIDNMLNLELLFWATRITGDSSYYKIAVNHAKTTAKNHFRDDFSSFHVVDYDTITGKVIKKTTHQGFADNSAWSRGQAWGLYGFTMCYRETRKPEFLEQAKHIANYIFTHPNLPTDFIPYWDFNAPNIPNEPRDVSSATVIASALFELSMYDQENSGLYKERANTILKNLTQHYRSKSGFNKGFLLLHSTGSKPGNAEVDVPLVYADYYFLEALLRKKRLENVADNFKQISLH